MITPTNTTNGTTTTFRDITQGEVFTVAGNAAAPDGGLFYYMRIGDVIAADIILNATLLNYGQIATFSEDTEVIREDMELIAR